MYRFNVKTVRIHSSASEAWAEDSSANDVSSSKEPKEKLINLIIFLEQQ